MASGGVAQPEFGDDVSVAVVVARIEKLAFASLHHRRAKLDDESADKRHERCLKSRRKATRDGLQRVFEQGKIIPRLQCSAKRRNRLAEAQNRPDKTQYRDCPCEPLDERVAGRHLLFIVFGLRLENLRRIADLTDVVQVGKCAFDSV